MSYRPLKNREGCEIRPAIFIPPIPLFSLSFLSLPLTRPPLPGPLSQTTIYFLCVRKGVLLEILLLGDLIVGYWNIFIRDVILFPQRRLFIKTERGGKKNLFARDASRWTLASTAKDLRFCRYCCWLQNLTSRCHWQDVAPRQAQHNRRPSIGKFFLG